MPDPNGALAILQQSADEIARKTTFSSRPGESAVLNAQEPVAASFRPREHRDDPAADSLLRTVAGRLVSCTPAIPLPVVCSRTRSSAPVMAIKPAPSSPATRALLAREGSATCSGAEDRASTATGPTRFRPTDAARRPRTRNKRHCRDSRSNNTNRGWVDLRSHCTELFCSRIAHSPAVPPAHTVPSWSSNRAKTGCAVELGVLDELALVPTEEPVQRADPQGAIARGQQRPDDAARQRRAHSGSRRDKPNAIKANQAKFRAEPKIAVTRLRHRVDPALQTWAIGPLGVRVLNGEAESVRGEGDGTAGKQGAYRSRSADKAPRCARA